LFIKIMDIAYMSTLVAKLTVDELQVNRDKLKEGFTPDIFATDEALRLVASGKSFRDAYKEVGLNLDKLKNEDPVAALKKRTSTGTPGNLNLKYAKKAASSYRAFAEKEHNALLDAVNKLTGKKILL
ncbi:MAG: argininosuccinate lyase, partial [Spirochaetia bacterium]|nr:argininosuccinate lyase [Spirochaetia bacterium]